MGDDTPTLIATVVTLLILSAANAVPFYQLLMER